MARSHKGQTSARGKFSFDRPVRANVGPALAIRASVRVSRGPRLVVVAAEDTRRRVAAEKGRAEAAGTHYSSIIAVQAAGG